MKKLLSSALVLVALAICSPFAAADTLTVYPEPGTAGTTADGYFTKANYPTFSTCVTSSTADSIDMSGVSMEAATTYYAAGPNYWVRRIGATFNTAALTSGATISSAVLSLNSNGSKDTTNGGSTSIVSFSPTADNNFVVGDYDYSTKFGSTVFASITQAAFNATDGVYNDYTLDANGISNISKTGISKFGVRHSLDLNTTTPTGFNRIAVYAADQAGTTSDPKLVITYTTANHAPDFFQLF